jgi:hypothetical protein
MNLTKLFLMFLFFQLKYRMLNRRRCTRVKNQEGLEYLFYPISGWDETLLYYTFFDLQKDFNFIQFSFWTVLYLPFLCIFDLTKPMSQHYLNVNCCSSFTFRPRVRRSTARRRKTREGSWTGVRPRPGHSGWTGWPNFQHRKKNSEGNKISDVNSSKLKCLKYF